jgi:chaperone modulatory protein CbpM
MTFNTEQFLIHARLDEATLEIWINEEWLVPAMEGDTSTFSEADLARAELIRDLMDDLGVNPEGVGVVLRLLDQVHGLRGALASLVEDLRRR